MKVELLTIGDEILDGRRVDTNTAWLGQTLSGMALYPQFRQSVTDRIPDIIAAFDLASQRSQLIFSTGGLGPTTDDLTFEAVAQWLNRPLVFQDAVWAEIIKKYQDRGLACPESNRRQALLPDGVQILPNKLGTAPGILFQHKDAWVACFPGVPREMKYIFENSVQVFLEEKLSLPQGYRKKYALVGLPESAVQDRITSSQLDDQRIWGDVGRFRLAYTASFPKIQLTATFLAEKDQMTALEIKTKDYDKKIEETFGDFIVESGENSLEETLLSLLKKKKWTLGVAESVTGGLIASKLIGVSGSSDVFVEGVVTYANASKIHRLGVEKRTLERFGAVSSQCALEMARGLQKTSGVDWALASTGIAGPGGGSEEKPVGVCYLALVGPKVEGTQGLGKEKSYQALQTREKVKSDADTDDSVTGPASAAMAGEEVCRFHFRSDRNGNRELAAYEGLKMLLKAVKSH